MANKVLIKRTGIDSVWATAIGADGYNNAITLAKELNAQVVPIISGKGWQIINKDKHVLATVTPIDASPEDDIDRTGATQQNLPAAINSTSSALNNSMQESVLVKEETASVVNFLKSFSVKNYAQANKYLEEVINSKLKARIKSASQETLFK